MLPFCILEQETKEEEEEDKEPEPVDIKIEIPFGIRRYAKYTLIILHIIAIIVIRIIKIYRVFWDYLAKGISLKANQRTWNDAKIFKISSSLRVHFLRVQQLIARLKSCDTSKASPTWQWWHHCSLVSIEFVADFACKSHSHDSHDVIMTESQCSHSVVWCSHCKAWKIVKLSSQDVHDVTSVTSTCKGFQISTPWGQIHLDTDAECAGGLRPRPTRLSFHGIPWPLTPSLCHCGHTTRIW